MTTDWKALCTELADVLAEEYGVQREFDSGDPLLGSGAIELLSRVRTALSQSEPEEPTDEELLMTYQHAVSNQVKSIVQSIGDYHGTMDEHAAVTLAGLHAVIARWPRAAIKPVPPSCAATPPPRRHHEH